MDRIVERPWFKNLAPRILKKQKVFFVQLGFEAKLKSLAVLEILRKAKIPVEQSISKDSLGAQLGIAERLEIPYVLIFGQKEALEHSVIVRDMENRSQETVKIEELSDYIKHLKDHHTK
jgi:histidyl-tRNA synthetase